MSFVRRGKIAPIRVRVFRSVTLQAPCNFAGLCVIPDSKGVEDMTRENIHHLPRLGMSGAMRLFGLTARALRFYEEKGLVEARRDRLNARYYDPVARGRLEWIARLRKAGVSLPDIEDVLGAEEDGKGRDCALRKLERRREALQAELNQVDEVLAEIQAPRSDGAARRLGRSV